jgi:integrase
VRTYAYSPDDEIEMISLLPEPAATIVAFAAFTGASRSEIRGLRWENYTNSTFDDGTTQKQYSFKNSVVEGHIDEPKTDKRRASVPIIAPLVTMLDAYREQQGNPQSGWIFANSKGKPLDLNNELFRKIRPNLRRCESCGMREYNHAPIPGHAFTLDAKDRSLPTWRGWHAFRRGLSTNLHALGVDDLTIQRILRHSDVSTTQKRYIKSLPKQSVEAMNMLSVLVENKWQTLKQYPAGGFVN